MAKSINGILKRELQVKVNGRIWLESTNGRFFGPGPVELLEQIAKTGSISSAAREMNMSYKKAWELITHLNTHTANPVIIPHAGGEKGGGTTLTQEALELIKYHSGLRKRFASFLEKETKRLKS